MAKEYVRFFLMILTSATAMYCATYLNTYEVGHVHWSDSRLYMTFIMAAIMAMIMLGFMAAMYRNRVLNLSIAIGSILIASLSLYLLRSQRAVDDGSYMRAMIPHHSIAILTSKRAQISDPRVRKLADGIIETQRREIEEMEQLIDDLKNNPKALQK